jgi:hypothetical protein
MYSAKKTSPPGILELYKTEVVQNNDQTDEI